MLIDWSKFIPAVVLLLTPIALFHGKRVRYRGVSRDWDGYWGRTFVLWTHLADFIRAALGAWWLAESLRRMPDAHGLHRYAPLFIQAPLLMIATSVQSLVCKEPDSANAPFAFVMGMVVGFIPPLLAGFASYLIPGIAVFLAVIFAKGVNAPPFFFPTLAVMLLAVGALFTQKKLLLPLGLLSCAVTLPWLLVLLFPRDLVVPYLAKRLVRPEKVPDSSP